MNLIIQSPSPAPFDKGPEKSRQQERSPEPQVPRTLLQKAFSYMKNLFGSKHVGSETPLISNVSLRETGSLERRVSETAGVSPIGEANQGETAPPIDKNTLIALQQVFKPSIQDAFVNSVCRFCSALEPQATTFKAFAKGDETLKEQATQLATVLRTVGYTDGGKRDIRSAVELLIDSPEDLFTILHIQDTNHKEKVNAFCEVFPELNTESGKAKLSEMIRKREHFSDALTDEQRPLLKVLDKAVKESRTSLTQNDMKIAMRNYLKTQDKFSVLEDENSSLSKEEKMSLRVERERLINAVLNVHFETTRAITRQHKFTEGNYDYEMQLVTDDIKTEDAEGNPTIDTLSANFVITRKNVGGREEEGTYKRYYYSADDNRAVEVARLKYKKGGDEDNVMHYTPRQLYEALGPESQEGESISFTNIEQVFPDLNETEKHVALYQMNIPHIPALYASNQNELLMRNLTTDGMKATRYLREQFGSADEAVRRLGLRNMQRILSHTLETVKAMHARGLVHGDIKPANIFIDEDTNAKEFTVKESCLSDYGFAGTLAGLESLKKDHGYRMEALFGTYYFPLEYGVDFERDLTQKFDVFQLGCAVAVLVGASIPSNSILSNIMRGLMNRQPVSIGPRDLSAIGNNELYNSFKRLLDLSRWMMVPIPEERPSLKEVENALNTAFSTLR